MLKYNNKEFNNLIEEVVKLPEFKMLKKKKHHGINRYEHCLRVAYYTYKVTKFLRLNYMEATKGAILHDFFTDEVSKENGYFRLIKHPKYALLNASKHFELSKLQVDIIKKHMFPVTIKPPLYLESMIVSLMDKIASIIERIYWIRNKTK